VVRPRIHTGGVLERNCGHGSLPFTGWNEPDDPS
jgi:hypothetical protein